MGLDFQTRLLNVNLTAVDKATEKEVEMFLVAIAKNPPTMNLNGYANINRGLITSVRITSGNQNAIVGHFKNFLQNISFMATYLVVLLQFKLTLLRQTARNVVTPEITESTIDNIS